MSSSLYCSHIHSIAVVGRGCRGPCTNFRFLEKGNMALLKHNLGPPRQQHLFYLVVKWRTTSEGYSFGKEPSPYLALPSLPDQAWGKKEALGVTTPALKVPKGRCYLLAFKTPRWYGLESEGSSTDFSFCLQVLVKIKGLTSVNVTTQEGRWGLLLPCSEWLPALPKPHFLRAKEV